MFGSNVGRFQAAITSLGSMGALMLACSGAPEGQRRGSVVPTPEAAVVHAQTQAASAGPPDRHTQVDAIFAPWTGKTTPGCAVGISRDGTLDYARGYGMANLEYDAAITPESIFHVASISKQFTAFSIRLLEQEGKLSLSDDIRTYLPEMPDYGKKISIADLIHHTSGLREQGQLLNLAGWRGDDLSTEADMLWALTKQRGLNYEPGTEPLYNNAGYTLLSVIVKRVSGQSLRAFADARIFKPLGMTDTHFHDDHTEIVPRRTSAYRPRAGGGWSVSIPVYDHYGSTSLFTTVGDLLKWEENFVHARVGGRALVTAMQTSGTLKSGVATGYGSGLWLETYRGLRTVGHSGMDAGYRADVITFPDQRLAIVALCNGATIAPDELTRKVADVYLGDRMDAAPPPAVKVPEAELSALAGVYWSPFSDEVVRLEVKDGALRSIDAPSPLVPLGDGVFRMGDTAKWQFSAPAADAPRELRITDGWPTPRIFTRVTAAVPAASTLAAFEGSYRIDEVDMTYTLRMTDGKLKLRWPRQKEATLEAIGGDRFVSDMLGTVTFTRTASGEVDGLTISNRRLRRLRARRLPAAEAPAARADKAPKPTSLVKP
ncbi:serine hydrolase domain-containing protein [Polyangium sp. y55x31]|uniref:serine hydrolase domain-containing protein n=1 Tax=Polyangium sp. y55x31 TaxID=3042688 RepID=UPI00248246A9|nr:serine hydrolase domain-containing protein [Polyangium sp. y55x31]MDI1476738.1 serine hydrolase domain-containing protein [Polyangium sp. y55x31]